jgi:hypothetical protein
MYQIREKTIDLEARFRDDGVVLTTIIETCPVGHGQRGRIDVEDEPNEDCNAWETLKHYRILQRTTQEAVRCDCGQPLVPHVNN